MKKLMLAALLFTGCTDQYEAGARKNCLDAIEFTGKPEHGGYRYTQKALEWCVSYFTPIVKECTQAEGIELPPRCGNALNEMAAEMEVRWGRR